MAGQSPASSPRLPSPPPMAEDQIGPTSPGVSLFEDHGKFLGPGAVDTGALRRILPGTKAEDMAEGPPLVELHDIDSAFPLTEHLKALHYSHTHPDGATTTRAITPEVARELSTPPSNTSKDIWLYELGRFLIQKTNNIIVGLFADSPSCSAQTCPEMRASEWQYLCAVHDPPKSCSAIDYCCHTLDWASTTLTSSKMFPSRLGLGSGSGALGPAGTDKVLQQQLKELTNIFRRVYRIYAHAWFQHREMFWRVEAKTGLYVLFKTVCDEYGLIQPENYTIPPEAEGLESSTEPVELKVPQERRESVQAAPTLLKRDDALDDYERPQENVGNTVIAVGDTSKRHRHTPSDRSASISTVIQEENEDEDDGLLKPTLPKTATSLQDLKKTPEPAATAEPAAEADAEPEFAHGLARANTVKAGHAGVEVEHDVEQTVIGSVEEAQEVTEPDDGATSLDELKEVPAAAAPEEAGKSIED